MSKIKWLVPNSRKFLNSGYLTENETPEKRIKDIANNAQKILGINGFSKKFEKYLKEGYYSLASPIWSNFGKKRGLPISCFGSYIEDNMGSILYSQAEVGMMSKLGGGTSGYFGEIRPRGSEITNNGKSSGSVHIMNLFQNVTNIVSQGQQRRGRFSPYLPVEHNDIEEFLEIGTEGNSLQELTHGVTITNEWMQKMKNGDRKKREIWAKILQRRAEMGYPYILFIDNANEAKPEIYKEKNKKIVASNLCTEIMLPSDSEESFVCCLSSMNLLYYDKWKKTDAVETLVYFLDAVMTEFIEKLEVIEFEKRDLENVYLSIFMSKTLNFAKNHRAIGLGALGWHSLLQSKNYAFDDTESFILNREIFKFIKDKSYKASEDLAEKFGPAPIFLNTEIKKKRRNTTLNAVAPTTSSAFILGQVSQSIEPIWSNCYVKDIAKLKVTIKNPILKELLIEKGKDTEDIWQSIKKNDGSVQHLDFLSDKEKEVFKTYAEIDQMTIVYQAANRQEFIDQGQSLNLTIHPDMPVKEVNKIYMKGWELGLKSFYYQHSINAAQKFKQRKECDNCAG